MTKKYGVFCLVAMAIMLFVSSCGKDDNPNPKIALERPASVVYYVAADTTLYRGTVYNVQVKADRTGPDGFLKTFKITRSLNGGADSTIIDAQINTLLFIQGYSFAAADSGSVEHYTFTIGNAEGKTASVGYSLTSK